jgi:hypothetical protein
VRLGLSDRGNGNFLELCHGEGRRTRLPRTLVNKALLRSYLARTAGEVDPTAC